jgi:hypothetical protein
MLNPPEWTIPPIRIDGKNDAGKQVIINSIGGTLTNAKGVIVDGPYKIPFKAMAKKLDKNGKVIFGKTHDIEGKLKPILELKNFISDPYWLVLMEVNGFYLHFQENEITF